MDQESRASITSITSTTRSGSTIEIGMMMTMTMMMIEIMTGKMTKIKTEIKTNIR